MLYLLISILTSSLLVILFKLFERYSINLFQAIVFNYVTASVCGIIISGTAQIQASAMRPGLTLAILLGILFVTIFNVVGMGVKKAGVAPVAVAQKMSLIMPVAFTLIYYHEPLGPLKIVGILLALVAIVCTSIRKETTQTKKQRNWIFLVLIFLGSGLIDLLVKFAQVEYLGETDLGSYIFLIFSAAATSGLLVLLILILLKKQQLHFKNVIAGILLGIPNYASMYYLVKSLSISNIESSVIFPVNNMGIIIVSAVAAYVLFREKLSTLNWAGIMISLVAIIIISFG